MEATLRGLVHWYCRAGVFRSITGNEEHFSANLLYSHPPVPRKTDPLGGHSMDVKGRDGACPLLSHHLSASPPPPKDRRSQQELWHRRGGASRGEPSEACPKLQRSPWA